MNNLTLQTYTYTKDLKLTWNLGTALEWKVCAEELSSSPQRRNTFVPAGHSATVS